MLKTVKYRSYDSHPDLPLDPDTDQYGPKRPIHTDGTHIAIVALGAFFGTLARYEIGILLPTKHDGWPMGTFLINLSGAFILGLLLQTLSRGGTDVGGRRILRLLIGTGFCGGYTTYSSLVTSAALLVRDSHPQLALTYALSSVIGGAITAALGIQVATLHHKRRNAA